MSEVTLTVGPPANGGSCVGRHDGRVIFVRHALPGEVVRAEVTSERGSYWHADAIEVIEASYVNEAYERVIASDVRYRFVIDTATI